MLTPALFNSLQSIAVDVAREAGQRILTLREEGVRIDQTKSSVNDIVTPADHEAERLIVERLQDLRPEDGIVAEEGHARTTSTGITWVIDPIDGTVNYLYNLPAFCVSLAATVDDPNAYADGRRAVAAAVYNPRTGEMFTAAKGMGATRNDEPVRINSGRPLEQSLVATGFGYTKERRLEQHTMLGRIIGEVRDIRRYGSAAYDLCLLASGRVDAYFERGIQPWDWAGGALVATEAGAVILGPDDATPPGSDLFIAGPPDIANRLRELLQTS